ncbi:hypothetical protein PanWU01x14_191240 [Parasponia andersonii]|uniref:Uncharacterized protein n=1 Tax=Parasponia andersonii TaxID=3476 RepID=A0A2P5C1X9_PARAD|nr:hypothetical protein PanWU01x14_191240 [Parasponia andersonii]
MRRVQLYSRCCERMSGASMAEKHHSGRSLFFNDEIQRDLTVWLRRRLDKSTGRRTGARRGGSLATKLNNSWDLKRERKGLCIEKMKYWGPFMQSINTVSPIKIF